MDNNIKSLTQSDDNEELYKGFITNVPTENNNNNNNTVNYNENNFQDEYIKNDNSKKNNINNITKKNNNINNNFLQLQKIKGNQNKKSTDLQSEIITLKKQIELKNQEIHNLNNKISLLTQQSNEINQENNILIENNDIFFQNFLSIINNFKSSYNMLNIQLPNYSNDDEQNKKNKDILYTLEVLINFIIDMCKNTDNNIFKFKEIKDKINLANKEYMENNKEKKNEVEGLKNKLIKMKNILDQNMAFLNEIREENYILKKRNLNLEKNINLISKSNEGFRKNIYMTQRVYGNNINNLNNINDINTSNMSIKTNKTNKTKNELLMEEFYDKENKIESLHNMANKILNNSLKEKNLSNYEKDNSKNVENILDLEKQYENMNKNNIIEDNQLTTNNLIY